MTDTDHKPRQPFPQENPNSEWQKGYAEGHKEGYERGIAAAQPLPTDLIAVRTPCPLPFMLAVMRAFGKKYPMGRMRQVGEWTHFFEDGGKKP